MRFVGQGAGAGQVTRFRRVFRLLRVSMNLVKQAPLRGRELTSLKRLQIGVGSSQKLGGGFAALKFLLFRHGRSELR